MEYPISHTLTGPTMPAMHAESFQGREDIQTLPGAGHHNGECAEALRTALKLQLTYTLTLMPFRNAAQI